jgi:predicted HTH transcriptional regulator
VLDRRDFNEDLISSIDRAMNFLKQYIPLRYEMTGEPRRKEIPEIPYEALREAIINAVAHRDYTATFKRPIEKWTKKLGEKLGENEIKIIELMKDNKYITAKELSEHIKISTTAVDNNISKLKKKGILKRIGPAKGGYWKVIKK